MLVFLKLRTVLILGFISDLKVENEKNRIVISRALNSGC